MSNWTSYPLVPLIFVVSLALSIGLTYAPCYSALCVEEFYPYATRVHIAVFYGLLASYALLLTLRAYNPSFRRLCGKYVSTKVLPVVGKRLSLGGIAIAIWIALITLASIGYWWPPQFEFYEARGRVVGWTVGTVRLAIVGVTGHLCDILLGLLILPISRNSILGSLFQLHTSTLLFTHKMLAYALLLAVVVHGVMFFAWLPVFALASDVNKDVYNIDNPTLSMEESEHRGYYYYTVFPSGMVGLNLFVLIAITSLPKVRRKSYNTFYYAHIICSCIFFFMVSIHASTDFYFLLPGLLLWLLDWTRRLLWLRQNKIKGSLENAGNGWYRISMPIMGRLNDSEKGQKIPLQTYYLNFPSISKYQCHAFTASAVSTPSEGPIFLFRRSEGKKQKKLDKEWTWELGALADKQAALSGAQPTTLDVRVEGPYITNAAPFFTATHVLCIVGGTGLTGAYSLATSWFAHRASEQSSYFRLVWSVRIPSTAELREIQELEERVRDTANMDLIVHISSAGGGRLNPATCLHDFLAHGQPAESTEKRLAKSPDSQAKCWVYCSGPEGLLDAAETACVDYKEKLRREKTASTSKGAAGSVGTFEWYCAKWDV